MIKIVAKFAITSAKREEFLEIVRELIHCSQQEAGCISYELYQEEQNPNQFVFIEEWRGPKAIAFHNSTKHYLDFKQKISFLTAAPPDVKRYHPAKYEK